MVARSLHGNWRNEHLFALDQALAHYDFLNAQIAACDQAISQALDTLPSLTEATVAAVKPLRNPHRTTAQQKQLHQVLHAMMGGDLTAIPTIAIETVLVLRVDAKITSAKTS